ncbi:MAG: hypothetical protein DRO99_03005 [Candidatus Aenigmatarchaeota archaeon]|nr:MAG: hypothetical protein DRO99_03005 [Candidatus Aenigmarchaeota archaeon]
MKILLCNPPARGPGCVISPALDIANLAGITKEQGHVPVIEDLFVRFKADVRSNRLFLDQIERHTKRAYGYIKGERPFLALDHYAEKIASMIRHDDFDLAGFTINSLQQFPYTKLLSALCISKKVKERAGAKVFLFGSFPQNYSKLMIESFDIIDYVLVQDDGLSFRDMLKKERHEKHEKTFCYREGNRTISPEGFNLGSLDDIPTPFFDKDVLKHYRHFGDVVLPYEVSRGCVNRCFFCYAPLKGMGVRHKSLDKAISDIKSMHNEYGISKFHFMDSEINFDKDYILSFCRRLIETGIKFKWTALAVSKNLSKEDIQTLRKAGCVQLRWGIESGSRKILATMDKNINIDESKNILKICSECGIKNHLSFIVGLPGETEKDMTDTMNFIKENKEYIDSANVCPYNVLNHITPLFFSDIDAYKKSLVSEDSMSRVSKARRLEDFMNEQGIFSLDIVDVVNDN